MLRISFLKLMGSLTLSLLLCGCFTASKASPYETNMMPPFSIRTNEDTPKTVYIQVRNTSGAPFLHVAETMAAAFEAQNYTITKNPNEAYYIIHATLPQAGEITELQQEMLLALGYGKTTSTQPTESLALATTSIAAVPVVEPTTDNVAAATSPASDMMAPPETLIIAVPGTVAMEETPATPEAATAVPEIQSHIANEPIAVKETNAAEKLDHSPLLYSMTMDMQISIRQPAGKRLRYQVRISTSTPKTDASFESLAPELTKHLAEGVVGIFQS